MYSLKLLRFIAVAGIALSGLNFEGVEGRAAYKRDANRELEGFYTKRLFLPIL